MTYIKCPACGARALNVATRCPSCEYVLTQNPMQLGARSSVAECRTCGKMIPRGSETCPYCGKTPSSTARWLVAALGGAVALAATVFVIQAVLPRAGDGAASQTPPAAAIPTAPAVVVGPPAAGPPTARPAARPPEAGPGPGAPETGVRPDLLVRWTGTWVNLREGRDTIFAVARVLQPGTRLEVADRQGGWWAVYQNGVVVGYVAGSSLVEEPPGGEAGPDIPGVRPQVIGRG